MITSYEKTKEDVLKCYDEFLKIVERANLPKEDRSLTALIQQAKKIKEDKFCLIVAGETNSGKSTFLNAYLGTDILPVSANECTSALIEICYGEEFVMKATFADGREQKYFGEQNIKEFLAANASLNDEYRTIPVTVINDEILLKYKDKEVPEKILQAFLKCMEKENAYNLPLEEYNCKIQEYIEKRKPEWRDLVVKIDIEKPFEDKSMRGIRILDSPGVNAVGKVGDITTSYIKSADAIMFVKPIIGAAVGTVSFKDFLDSNSMDRNKNALFLILTFTTAGTSADNKRALDAYVAMYEKNGILKEQIIPVDSKAECYYKLFQECSTDEIKVQLKALRDNGQAEPFLREAWLDAVGDKDAFLRNLRKYSNFDVVDQALNRFGYRAHFWVLNEFLGRMLKVYDKIAVSLSDTISAYELKAKDPTKLAAEIGNAKTKLAHLKKKMDQTEKNILEKYVGCGTNGIIVKKAEKVMKDYLDEIEEIDGKSDTGLDELEKLALQQVDKFIDFEKELQQKIVNECNGAMIELSDKSAIVFNTLEPDFSEEVINEIKEKMRDEATEESFVTKTGKCGKKIIETFPRFLQDKYYDLVKNHIIKEIEGIKKQAIKELNSFVTHTVAAYKKELENNVKIKEEELTQIESEKKTADEIAAILSELKNLLQLVDPQKTKVMGIKGGIDCCE